MLDWDCCLSFRLYEVTVTPVHKKVLYGAEKPIPLSTGREWDKETGLFYYRARYYDPIEGKFISKDPIGFEGGINLYGYVQGNPTSRRDPSGLYPCNGGIWDQAIGDRQYSLAFGGYVSYSRVNYTC